MLCWPTHLRLARNVVAELPTLVLASANPDKVAEIATLLDGIAELLPRPDHIPDVVEDAPDLVGNACLKAAAICEATGLPAVADDTGLEVDALGGAPGVFTARFAGENATYDTNVAKLLSELDGVPAADRTARFKTVAMIVWPDGSELSVEGVVEGVITERRSGDGGFGYDPVFAPDEAGGKTFAEMGEDKHVISHRGRAFRSLAAALESRP